MKHRQSVAWLELTWTLVIGKLFLYLVVPKFAWHLPAPSSSLWWGRLGVPCVVLCLLSLRFKVHVCVYVLCVSLAYILVSLAFKLGFCHLSMHLVTLLGLNKSLSFLIFFHFFIWLLDASDSTIFLPILSHFGHWCPNCLKWRAIGLGFWPWVFDMVLVCPSMLLVVQKYRTHSHPIP